MKVLAPRTLIELQDQVRQLHAEAAPWLPAGLGSRLDWGPPVQAGSVVLSGRALGGILSHSPEDFTVTVAAGTPLAALQQELAARRQWLCIDRPWGGPDTSIGGMIARGLSGGYRQRYMGLRDQLLGLQLLRSDGVLARAGGRVVKNVAGYDLMRLLAGSWGSLALITEVTLRTQPIPPQRRALVVQAELSCLQQLSRWLLQASLSPERIDLWSGRLAAAAGRGDRPLLLLSLASIDLTTLNEQIRCIGERAPDLEALDDDAAAHLLGCARGLGASPNDQWEPGDAWLLRLAVPPAQACNLLAADAAQGMAVCLAAGSGIGDGWAHAAGLARHRVEALRRHCQALGGYLSVLRQPNAPPGSEPVAAWLDAPARPLIEAVKRQFDPKQQLARGRLPGVAQPAR